MKTKVNLLMVFSFTLFGCGMIAKHEVGIPKEQIDKDLTKQVVDVQKGLYKQWSFAHDNERCFTIVGADSRSTNSTVDVVVKVGLSRENFKPAYDTVFGTILMKYKKDGDSWILDKVEAIDLFSQLLEGDKYKEWLDMQMPLCQDSKFVK